MTYYGYMNERRSDGYRRGSEYVATLACMSVKVYLTPGSDGSCRAAPARRRVSGVPSPDRVTRI